MPDEDDGPRAADGAALLAAVRAIGACTDAYRRAVATAVDLGTADLVALSLLQREEPQRASQIGEWTGLTPGSVTALLDRLESRGFLTRIRPTHDRRSLDVCLTPEGPRARHHRDQRPAAHHGPHRGGGRTAGLPRRIGRARQDHRSPRRPDHGSQLSRSR